MATALHKVEQAKYWASLKQKYGKPALPARSKAAVEEQMTACFKSMYGPPGRQLLAMLQAGCEEEVMLLLVPVTCAFAITQQVLVELHGLQREVQSQSGVFKWLLS